MSHRETHSEGRSVLTRFQRASGVVIKVVALAITKKTHPRTYHLSKGDARYGHFKVSVFGIFRFGTVFSLIMAYRNRNRTETEKIPNRKFRFGSVFYGSVFDRFRYLSKPCGALVSVVEVRSRLATVNRCEL